LTATSRTVYLVDGFRPVSTADTGRGTAPPPSCWEQKTFDPAALAGVTVK
jgi:hypothetical protein